MGWPAATVSLSGAGFLEDPGAGCGEDGELPGQAAKHWGEGGASSEALASIVLKHNVSVYAAVSVWRVRAKCARVCRCGVCVCVHAHMQRKGKDECPV